MKRLHVILISLLALCASVVQAQVSVETTSGITTAVTGSVNISLDGNWTNNGTLTAGTGSVLLNGNGLQTITNANGAFNNLIINKSSGDAQAAGNFTVDGTFALTSGDVDLNGKVITLGTNALLAETPGNPIKGASGYITTTRNLNAPSSDNVGGLGFEITSVANLGSTVIQRGHAAQSGNGKLSILRYFDVIPTNNSGLNATLLFRYDDSELNGQTEANLALYKSDDGGSTWSAQGGTADASVNTITLSGIESFSRWTAADQSLAVAPHVVDAGADQAICLGQSVQIGGSPTASGGTAPYSFSWSPPTGLDDASIANPTASPSATTTYTVTVTDANNGSTTDEVVVTVHKIPVADAGADVATAPGVSAQLGGNPTASGSGALTINWRPAAGLNSDSDPNPIATPSSTTTYTLIVSNENGCVATDEVTVTVANNVNALIKAVIGPTNLYDPVLNQVRADIAIKNISTQTIYGPISAVFKTLNPGPPTITIPNAHGGGEGLGCYYVYSGLLGGDGKLDPGETTGYKLWIFQEHVTPPVSFRFFADVIGVLNGTAKMADGSEQVPLDLSFDMQNGTLQDNALTKSAGAAEIPATYALHQNYPNPFNPTTTIQFDLREAGEVTLKIYNSVGQLVRTLVSGDYEAGAHSVIWDARNDAGVQMASGVYLAVFKAGGIQQVRRVVLMK